MHGFEGGRPGRPGDGVIVTGASTGLGLEIALKLAEDGFRTFATVRDDAGEAAVQAAATARDVRVGVLRMDLTDPASIATAVQAVVDATGGVFGLVNNAGIGLRGAVEDSTQDEIRRVFETNVVGTIAVTRAVLPSMRAARCGRIITITSVGGRVPGFGVSVYCSSKFAQEGLAEGMSLELAPFGIQSIIVEPGMIKTERWQENRGTASGAEDADSPYHGPFWASEEIADKIVERSPTTPAEVGATVSEALKAESPRLRYVVGRGARVVIFLRRHLPQRTFERLYYGGHLRRLRRKVDPHRFAPPSRPEVPR